MLIDPQIDWQKKPTPCQTPGCNWPNWHICLVGQEETEVAPVKRAYYGRVRGETSTSAKENMSAGQQDRWARRRELEKPRDEAMIDRYKEPGTSMLDIQNEFGVSRTVVMRVLHEAARQGRVVIRSRGVTKKATT